MSDCGESPITLLDIILLPPRLLNNWRRKESKSNHLHKKTSCPDRNQKRFTAKSVCTCTWCCVT